MELNLIIPTTSIDVAHPLPLKYFPNPILSQPCVRVEESKETKLEIAAAMIKTTRQYDGVGLAGPQVGMTHKVLVWESTPGLPHAMFNPTDIELDISEWFKFQEGCLSVPGYFETRERAIGIQVVFEDYTGTTHTAQFRGLEAFIIQHELDHLNGQLFIDNLSKLKKDRLARKINKQLNNRV